MADNTHTEKENNNNNNINSQQQKLFKGEKMTKTETTAEWLKEH